LGRKAWFGPKRTGWGLSPVSPEGWAVLLAAVAAMAFLSVLTHSGWVCRLPRRCRKALHADPALHRVLNRFGQATRFGLQLGSVAPACA